MSADDLTAPTEADRLSRRRLLVTTGLGASLGAVLAACGSSDDGAPGRVGYAPVPTEPPEEPVDDAVLLRTATSLEYTALDVYDRITELGALDDTGADLVSRFVEDHTSEAATMAELTGRAGGEPFECANPWFAERVIPEMFERITGREDVPEGEEPIPPSDDPARDAMGIAYAIESTLAAMYQGLVVELSDPELRTEAITAATRAARHAAAAALARDGAPQAYVSPLIIGGELDPSANEGLLPVFAVPGHFGSLAPVQVAIGPASDAGTRFTTSLQTPAANSYAYASLSCDA